MSGVYDDAIRYVTTLAGSQLEQLRVRSISLGTGAGDYEQPAESKRLVDTLGAKGIPCRFHAWGPGRNHSWSTWREQLPVLLEESL